MQPKLKDAAVEGHDIVDYNDWSVTLTRRARHGARVHPQGLANAPLLQHCGRVRKLALLMMSHLLISTSTRDD